MRRPYTIDVTLTLALGIGGAVGAQESSCVSCHESESRAEDGRPHASAGIACVDCHGGDPDEAEKEAAHGPEGELLGAGGRRRWVLRCGECHADVATMNPYGLPTDQLAQYRLSRHGEVLFEDPAADVATCVSCHGAHGVLSATDPNSPVHPTHVPSTCASCHGDPAFAEEHGLDAEIIDSYRGSVHGRLLLEEGDSSAPQCATCHGNHGAVPPGFSALAAVCGKCHVRQREQFLESAHAPLVEQGFQSCVVCHGKHDIQPPTEDTYTRPVCGLCHAEDSEALQTRGRLASAMRRTRTAYEEAEQHLKAARRHSLATDTDQLMLENAHTKLLEMEVAQHSLDLEKIEEMAAEARSTLADLEQDLEEARAAEETKRIALIPVALFLAAMSLGFWFRFRRIHEDSRT